MEVEQSSSTLNGKDRILDDALFLERLDIVYKKSLADLRSFAERESCSFDDVRRHVAEWHCKDLFQSASTTSNSSVQDRLHNILRGTSQNLESLEGIAGLHSFFLVVNPKDATDEGFLGGTVLGRDFWRGYRGGGATGARAFKEHCAKVLESQTPCPAAVRTLHLQGPQKKSSASELKKEIYAAVRNALRAVSSVRTAEMKWTNHARLDTYGVSLVGWPSGVPMQNPSTLSVAQNSQVLEALKSGCMHFVRLDGAPSNEGPACSMLEYAQEPQTTDNQTPFDDSADISWGYQEQDDDSETKQQQDKLHVNSRAIAAVYPPSTLTFASRATSEALDVQHDVPAAADASSASRKRRRGDE